MTIYDFIKARVAEITAVKTFHFGSFKYVQGKMIEATKNSNYADYFPMVMMVTEGFDYDMELDDGKQEYPLQIVIVDLTKQNYTTQQSLDNVFIPVLNPIYVELINKLKVYYSNEFSRLPHNKKDHFFYSAEEAKDQNKLAEYLDAVEITDLDFIIDLNSCVLNN